jgi:hypothetical protein
VRDMHIPIFVLMLLVDATHQGRSRRQHLIHEDENGLLGRQLDALANYVDELSNSKVGGDKIFLLVDGCDVRFLYLFADDGDAIGVFLSL